MFKQSEPDLPFSIQLADTSDTKGKIIKGKEESFGSGEELCGWWHTHSSHVVANKKSKRKNRKPGSEKK